MVIERMTQAFSNGCEALRRAAGAQVRHGYLEDRFQALEQRIARVERGVEPLDAKQLQALKSKRTEVLREIRLDADMACFTSCDIDGYKAERARSF